MGICKFCGKTGPFIAEVLEICRNCILQHNWDDIRVHILNVHKQVRKLVDLPDKAPFCDKKVLKLSCNYCMNNCKLGPEDVSYCGLRNMKKNLNGDLPLPTNSTGYIYGYLDRNPTNCCNAWICPAGTSNGYPNYSDVDGPEYGTYSYAAFLYGCTFNCLFCQNESHKYISKKNLTNVDVLANQIAENKRITCMCYFGGTPEAQLPFTINLANKILEKIEKTDIKRKFRVCWEWNGSGNTDLIEECMEIAIRTGGNIKFDLKTFHEKLNYALCGASNKKTLENFKYLADKFFGIRKGVPEMSACTLMVPGYINHEEVELIAQYISSINKKIPYSLLVFHGAYQMKDLPLTSKEEAIKCYKVATQYLNNVIIGNKFLLGFY
ncbi:MAG: radical SAM protein [Candidatus Lokiarchaeota archaeon]|nr:radical SAM protein [Candidatus Lokiarchaeota archaeon]